MLLQIIHLPGKKGSDYSNLLYVGKEDARNLKLGPFGQNQLWKLEPEKKCFRQLNLTAAGYVSHPRRIRFPFWIAFKVDIWRPQNYEALNSNNNSLVRKKVCNLEVWHLQKDVGITGFFTDSPHKAPFCRVFRQKVTWVGFQSKECQKRSCSCEWLPDVGFSSPGLGEGMRMPCICLIKLNGKTLSTEEGGQEEKVESETGQNRTGKKKAEPQLKWFRTHIILKAVVSE